MPSERDRGKSGQAIRDVEHVSMRSHGSLGSQVCPSVRHATPALRPTDTEGWSGATGRRRDAAWSVADRLTARVLPTKISAHLAGAATARRGSKASNPDENVAIEKAYGICRSRGLRESHAGILRQLSPVKSSPTRKTRVCV
jgi:hypothetical protein